MDHNVSPRITTTSAAAVVPSPGVPGPNGAGGMAGSDGGG
jgi:hypothetical protein